MDEKTPFDIETAFWRQPGYRFLQHGESTKMDSGHIEKMTVDVCLMPNLNLNEQCNECIYYTRCSFERKRMPKELKKKKSQE